MLRPLQELLGLLLSVVAASMGSTVLAVVGALIVLVVVAIGLVLRRRRHRSRAGPAR